VTPRFALTASLGGMLLAGLPAASARAPAVRLQLQQAERLPFTAMELQIAVAARLPLAAADAPGFVVVVTPAGAGQIEVVSSLRRQQVAASDQTPADAARLVALAVVDVTRDPTEGSASGPATPEASVSGTAAESATAAPTAPAEGGMALAVMAGSSFGFTRSGAVFEPALAVDYVSRSPWTVRGAPVTWGLGLAVGYARSDARVLERDFRLETWPLRLGPSLGWRWLQASAGPVLRLYRTSGVDGGRGSIGGGFVGLHAGVPLPARFRVVLAVGCDGYTERLDFRAGALSVVHSQFLVPWMGLGVGWGRPS
jgi:hypothetical protein